MWDTGCSQTSSAKYMHRRGDSPMADWQTVSVFAAPVLLGYLLWLVLGRRSLLAVALRGCFFVYVVGVIGVTLFPMPVTADEVAYHRALPDAYQAGSNLVPFASIQETIALLPPQAALLQLAGNLFLLLPLGYLAPIMWPRIRNPRQALTLLLVVSLSIEATQRVMSLLLGSSYKSLDVDDVILNLAGGCLGYALYVLIAARLAEFDFS